MVKEGWVWIRSEIATQVAFQDCPTNSRRTESYFCVLCRTNSSKDITRNQRGKARITLAFLQALKAHSMNGINFDTGGALTFPKGLKEFALKTGQIVKKGLLIICV